MASVYYLHTQLHDDWLNKWNSEYWSHFKNRNKDKAIYQLVKNKLTLTLLSNKGIIHTISHLPKYMMTTSNFQENTYIHTMQVLKSLSVWMFNIPELIIITVKILAYYFSSNKFLAHHWYNQSVPTHSSLVEVSLRHSSCRTPLKIVWKLHFLNTMRAYSGEMSLFSS